ncbi:MAG: tetratricopeptide repeat protein [Elusimicrobia bacterium]|nr:tetratricopeptide repeat protein [Elusimicrobiota bacterium]
MKSALALMLAVTASMPAHANDDDVDLTAAHKIQQSKSRIQSTDQQLKSTPPERREELRRQREAEVTSIVDIARNVPKSPGVNQEAGQALYEVKEHTRAREFAAKSVELSPGKAGPRVLLASVDYELGRYPDALASAREALRVDPGNKAAQAVERLIANRLRELDRRVSLGKPGGWDASAAGEDAGGGDSRRGPSAPGGDPAAINSSAERQRAEELRRQAEQRLRLGDPAQALKLAERAVALDPSAPQGHLLKGAARLRAGAYRQAIDDATRAIELGAAGGRAHAVRGRAQARVARPTFVR